MFLSLLTAVAYFILVQARNFHKDKGPYTYPYEKLTLNGNLYQHDTLSADSENGNRVWVYICGDELREEWSKKGSIPFDTLDLKGQHLRYTLIRYLTSAGLRKDSAGVSMLTPEDFRNIEGRMTNKMFSVWSPWNTKLYEIIWHIDYYRRGGNPSGHSITQRIEFLKTGLNLFRRYPVSGTGTCDLRKEYLRQYELDGSPLQPHYRLLSHNQYLAFLCSFGITGFILIMFALLTPCFATVAYRRYLPALFLLLMFLSMLWEDTLETHTGVSFFAYFYSVFILSYEEEREDYGKRETVY